MVRSPAVAGRFYPGRKEELGAAVRGYLLDLDAHPSIGIVSPHAGYMFSGAIAGETFSSVQVPDTVMLLGPNHYGLGAPLALWPGEAWDTPLGRISIDTETAGRLQQLCPALESDTLAHQQEHSLEVQVPFIQAINSTARLVPVSIGRASLGLLKEFGEAMARVVLESEKQILIVASSDMTHFESAESAAQKDKLALDRVLHLDPEGLYVTVRDLGISMCGVLPVVTMLYAARQLGARKTHLVRYGNSGETTGDYADVVGYAGVVIQ